MPSLRTEKRGIVSKRRRRSLLLLVTELQNLQDKFPELRDMIQSDVDGYVHLAKRTRESDRRAVLDALKPWQDAGVSVDEIATDTGLSESAVRKILDELLKADPPQLDSHERFSAADRGQRTRYYYLLPA